MKKNITWVIGVILLIGIIWISAWFFTDSSDVIKNNTLNRKKEDQSFQTITPTLSKNTSHILLGKIISNEVANIYPRRQGIIQDIYVDIGDVVQQGDVLGTLLPQWVEWQSSSIINEKQARLNQAQVDLLNKKLVAQEAIANAQQSLKQKEITLDWAQKEKMIFIKDRDINLETTIENEKAKVAGAKQSIAVVQSNISLLETTILKEEKDENTRIQQSQTNIDQTFEQAEVQIEHMKTSIEFLFTRWDENLQLWKDEIPRSFWAKNTQTRTVFQRTYSSFIKKYEDYKSYPAEERKNRVQNILVDAVNLTNKVLDILENTVSGSDISEEGINAHLNSLHTIESNLLRSKEAIEDSINMFRLSETWASVTLSRLQQELEREKEKLKQAEENYLIIRTQAEKNIRTAEKNLQTTDISRTSTVEILQEDVKTAQQNLEFVQAQQKQILERAENDVSIYQANLGLDIVTQEHQRIVSPFSGTISKRFIIVGEPVMLNNPLFEMIDVDTSLSKNASREIVFWLPEELQTKLQIGDTFSFFLSNEEELFDAEVTRKSPQIDTSTQTVTIQAKIITERDFAHNSSVRIRLQTDIERYKIPSSLVKREDDINFIWILWNNDTPIKKEVSVFFEDGEFAEVSWDIDISTRLVTNLPRNYWEK